MLFQYRWTPPSEQALAIAVTRKLKGATLVRVMKSIRLSRDRLGSQAGIATAEYAVTTVAACGFAGVLYKVLSSNQVLDMLTQLIGKALSWVFG